MDRSEQHFASVDGKFACTKSSRKTNFPWNQSSFKHPINGKQRLSGDSFACAKPNLSQNFGASVSLPLTNWHARWPSGSQNIKTLQTDQCRQGHVLCKAQGGLSHCKILFNFKSRNYFTVEIKLAVSVYGTSTSVMGLFALTKWNNEWVLFWFVLIHPQWPAE